MKTSINYLIALALIALTACQSSLDQQKDSQPAESTQEVRFEMQSSAFLINPSSSEESNARQRSLAGQMLEGELTAVNLDTQEIHQWDWVAFFDQNTFVISSYKVILLEAGTYRFNVLLNDGEQQYAGEIIHEVDRFFNHIPFNIHPVIGDPLSDTNSLGELMYFQFRYDAAVLAQFDNPKLGVIVDSGEEEYFVINPSTGHTEGWFHLAMGEHHLQLKLYDGEQQRGQSLPEQETLDIAPNQEAIMDLVGLNGELLWSFIPEYSLFEGELLATLGVQSFDNEEQPLEGVEIWLGDTLLGATQHHDSGRVGLWTGTLPAGELQLRFVYEDQTQEQLLTLSALQAYYIELHFEQPESPSPAPAPTPEVQPLSLTSPSRMGLGAAHTCFIMADQQLKCWGNNSNGRLGLGHQSFLGNDPNEMGDHLDAVNLGDALSARSLAVGDHHSCALLDSDQVKCWGKNHQGQLGLGHTQSIGNSSSETGDGLLIVDLGPDRSVQLITAGAAHTCALLDNNQVQCWGANDQGQLGIGSTEPQGDESHELGSALLPVALSSTTPIVDLAAGATHTCVLFEDGKVQCWGANDQGQLGLGETQALALAVGGHHTCVQLTDTEVQCWGATVPHSLSLSTTQSITHLVAGGAHTCAVLDDQEVKCWGSNEYGQLGYGHTNSLGDEANEVGPHLASIDLPLTAPIIDIEAGADHTCVLTEDEALYCWGRNQNGQLGLEDRNHRGDEDTEMGSNLNAVEL